MVVVPQQLFFDAKSVQKSGFESMEQDFIVRFQEGLNLFQDSKIGSHPRKILLIYFKFHNMKHLFIISLQVEKCLYEI